MAQNANQFDWVDFYRELAEKLLAYKNNRQELIVKVKQIFSDSGLKMPKLENNNQLLVDIDPFTVFGLFNKSKMTIDHRIKIINVIKKIFGITAPIPSSFAGIPVLYPESATFYSFAEERKDGDIDNLWGLLESALVYAVSPTTDNRNTFFIYFDLSINLKYNGNGKITMVLYWIAPDVFLNLDSRNIQYIYKSEKIPSSVVKTLPIVNDKITASTYFDIIGKIRAYLESEESQLKNFMELSAEAFRYSEEKKNKKQPEDVSSTPDTKTIATSDVNVEPIRYWLYSPGEEAKYWNEFYSKGIMAICWSKIGDLELYKTRRELEDAIRTTFNPKGNPNNDSLATWQFVHEMKPGDIVFAKKGRNTIIGRGIVQSNYEFDESRDSYKNVRKVNWTHKGEWSHPGKAVLKTLTDITSYTDYVKELNKLLGCEEIEDDKVQDAYSKKDFLDEVYMDEASYETLVGLVQNKQNVILQGAPGVGKTFTAERLAYSIMGVKDIERVMMVQFHQSYSYEDFIMGFRPSENGFKLELGAFYKFCKKAGDDRENKYFFIIDEINRGNLSKIFGELLMLIENDKRGVKIRLLYSDEKFSVPDNVYIIGMMNTADRSLALLDYALRRRFAFYEMKPGFDAEGFIKYRDGLNSEKFNRLIDCVKELNEAIANDDSLGDGFCIGHSYFCELKEVSTQSLKAIIEYEILPLLKEYWFDEPEKIKDWVKRLREAIK